MKSRTETPRTTAASQKMMVETMLAKRDTLVAERDELVAEFNARLETMEAGIESLDAVLAMFDPRHVPLEIRNVQRGASMLTISARPFLTETLPAPVAEAGAKPAGKKRGPKPKSAAGDAPSESTDPTGVRMAAVVAEKAGKTAKTGARAKKREEAAREAARTYFAEIDKLKTLQEIIQSAPDGIPFRKVKELFLKRHPLEVKTQEMKKVFSDRLSSILYSMSQGESATVQRSERIGPDGKKEWAWVSTRPASVREDTGEETEVRGAA